MGIGYTLAYRLGVTPWERAGAEGDLQFERLLEPEQAAATGGARALDLGCGRGLHAVRLAQHGWRVTGVDLVPRALEAARRHASEAGQDVDFVTADVTSLPPAVGTGYRFFLDVGCFHGLAPTGRTAFGAEVNRVATADATMLVLAFAPGGRGPIASGAGAGDLAAALPGWSITDQEPADTTGMPGPLRSRAPQFYRLARG